MRKMAIHSTWLILICTAFAGAATINYTVSGWGPNQYPASITPPANAPWGVDGYPGDTVELAAYTGTLDLTPGSYSLKINTLAWTIDYTYGGTETDPEAWSDVLFNFSAVRNISFDASPAGSIGQNGSLNCTWDGDFLDFSNGAGSTFIVGGFQVSVTPLALSQYGWNLGAQTQQNVMAEFVVTEIPEPMTLSLLGLGGLLFSRKK